DRDRRVRRDPGDLHRQQRPDHRRPRRGTSSPRAELAAPQRDPAAALPQQGVLAVRAPDYAARRRGLRWIDLRRAITTDFPLKAAALAISILAFVAVAESTQEAQAAFQVPVERPAVPAGYVLRGTLGEVTVKLRGPQSEIAKIAQGDLHPVPDLAQADLDRNDVHNVAVRVPLSDTAITVRADAAA